MTPTGARAPARRGRRAGARRCHAAHAPRPRVLPPLRRDARRRCAPIAAAHGATRRRRSTSTPTPRSRRRCGERGAGAVPRARRRRRASSATTASTPARVAAALARAARRRRGAGNPLKFNVIRAGLGHFAGALVLAGHVRADAATRLPARCHAAHPQLLDHRPHRPRQVDAGRPLHPALRRPRRPRDGGAGARLDGPRARARHHDQGADRGAVLQGARRRRSTAST